MFYPISEIELLVSDKLATHPQRLLHTHGVVKMALYLGSIYHLDLYVLEVAALLHDFCKYDTIEEQKKYIHDDEILNMFSEAPEIYHAYAASNYAKEVLLIDDERITNAIKYHVFGRKNMNIYEAILMVSDYAEENRTIPGCIKVHRFLMDTPKLTEGVKMALDLTISYLESQHITPLKEEYEIQKELEWRIKENELIERNY